MATGSTRLGPHPHAGVVYIDGWHALVTGSADPVHVTGMTRSHESEPEFVSRVARATDDCDCLVILGPDEHRLELEHEFEVLYERPHLLDVEAAAGARPVDLLDRLRFLEALAPS
jgi:hypothetical protein